MKEIKIKIEDIDKANEIYGKMLNDIALKMMFRKGIFKITKEDNIIKFQILKETFNSPRGIEKVNIEQLVYNIHLLFNMMFKLQPIEYDIEIEHGRE